MQPPTSTPRTPARPRRAWLQMLVAVLLAVAAAGLIGALATKGDWGGAGEQALQACGLDGGAAAVVNG